MPKFKKLNLRGNWDEQNMKTAVEHVLTTRMTIRQAALSFEVPKSSLADRLKKIKNGIETTLKPYMGIFRPTFPVQYEEQLVAHIKDLDNRLMPLSRQEFGKLSYKLAEALKLPHRFNKTKQCAGRDFYYNFIKRHPELSLRTAESTSLQRAVGFNKPQVDRFFEKLRQLMEKYNFHPSKIFNADETGVTNVHENRLKVLSLKGKKQVGKLTSGERGRSVTIMLCMNASGDQFIPPFFIFPRKRMNDRLTIAAPEGSQFAAQDNGWMTGPIFIKWFETFIARVHPTKEEPVLLIVDGHCSHKDLDVILMARNNNVHMLSLPPHCTHRLQPLDRTIMKPFKDAYNEACSLWMRTNPFSRITDYEISGLVRHAFTKICRMDIAKKGFECTGIYPYNPNIFTDLDYLPSQGLDIPENLYEETRTRLSAPTTPSPSPPNSSTRSVELPPGCDSQMILNLPGTSKEPIVSVTPLLAERPSTPDLYPQPSTSVQQLLEKISPLPSAAERRLTVRKRRSAKSEILTSTPFKNELEIKNMEKEQKSKKKAEVKKRLILAVVRRIHRAEEKSLRGKGKELQKKRSA